MTFYQDLAHCGPTTGLQAPCGPLQRFQ